MQSYVQTEPLGMAQAKVHVNKLSNVALTTAPIGNHNQMARLSANIGNLGAMRDDLSIEDLHKLDPMAVSPVLEDRPVYFALKRIMDFTVTLLAMVFLLPLMAVIAALVALDSSGPVIFTQERVGARRIRRNGRIYWQRTTFKFHKFRSMYTDADQELHRQFVQAYIAGDHKKMADIQPDKDGADMFKLNGDPRVTPIGKFLRKTSLDELPQFWNVLRGEMSLVGPRPPIPYEVEMYSEESMKRLATVPGLTGLWQMEGRGELGFNEMVELDLKYIKRQSLWLDIKILFGTIPAVLMSKGAK